MGSVLNTLVLKPLSGIFNLTKGLAMTVLKPFGSMFSGIFGKKEKKPTEIFGASASIFEEGIDVPGEALSVLVIVKLPFDVPSDPIIAARAESFDDSFYQYSLPEAILRFRQGFGRLIRSQNDRGVIAIFDRRVISKKYGRFFIESLPQCTVKVGPLSDLPATASRWLNI